ncbi:hypothetical protein DFJ74DRAFT_704093 [Hyaloraphidium curvatum]|nr:hypothetical protein DFJ74DRAFT_704093 [Hyaloraphidium curvatum]
MARLVPHLLCLFLAVLSAARAGASPIAARAGDPPPLEPARVFKRSCNECAPTENCEFGYPGAPPDAISCVAADGADPHDLFRRYVADQCTAIFTGECQSPWEVMKSGVASLQECLDYCWLGGPVYLSLTGTFCGCSDTTSGHISQKDFGCYASTKGAVLQLARSLAVDLAPLNIRCNSVSPGTIFSAA